MTERGIISVAAGAAEQAMVGPSRFTFVAPGAQSGDAFSLILYEAPPGAGSPWHTHAHEDEAFYVEAGQLTFQFEGRTVAAGPGCYLFIPRGQRHAFANQGQEPVRALILATPGGLDRYFAEAAQLIAAGGATAAQFEALNRRYGLAFEPPN